MFKILGQDGKEYGPVTAEVVRRWIAEGRATAQTRVLLAGSAEWKTLGELAEFAEDLARRAAPPAGRPASAAPPVPPSDGGQGPVKTLAVVSLVLGLLSFVTFFVAGIPAIITGAIARSRASRDPARYGGGGMALAGLILGCVGVALTFVLVPLALLLPALHSANARAQRINCVSNLKQIGLAARIFAVDHNDVFPQDFLSMSNELTTPKVLTCPTDSARKRMNDWTEYSPENVTYEFLLPGAKEAEVTSQPVFRCPIHNNVGYGDGSVQMEGGPPGGPRPRSRR